MSKRLIVLFAAVLALTIAAGCGSSDDNSDSTAAAAATKAEFIKQGDAICEKGSKAIEDGAEEFAEENDVDTEKPTKAQQEEVIVDVVAPGVREQAEGIDELGAPSGDEEEVEAIVAAVKGGAEELEDEPGLLLEEENPLEKGAKLAGKYGFKACGQG